ncbi:hypothetical protein BGX27_003939 [Mortierella sp. AM989]|nr:hypothetical protein BGX27_003939 [Mortierella sp. AM989]
MTIAILFFGNAGAGKSTLLSQIGGKFESGVRFRKGFTKDIHEAWVKIHGQDVLLMDVPGLFEPDDRETEYNARKLTEALRKGYEYKLYFVLKASNRGPDDAEMLMMARINECVGKAKSKATFRVIVNQIQEQDIYEMYEKNVAADNCRGLFEMVKIEGYSFDIKVENVLLIRYDKRAIELKQLQEVIGKDVMAHSVTFVDLIRDIFAKNEDLNSFSKAFHQLMENAWSFLVGLFHK